MTVTVVFSPAAPHWHPFHRTSVRNLVLDVQLLCFTSEPTVHNQSGSVCVTTPRLKIAQKCVSQNLEKTLVEVSVKVQSAPKINECLGN